MRLSRYAAVFLATLALPVLGGGTLAQTPSVPSASPAPAAPTLPSATAPTLPARIGTPVSPAATGAVSPAATGALSPAATGGASKIDINAASEGELATLPGIGPVTAKAIVDGRPWDDLAALSKKKVMSQPVFARNKDHFALANINTSSAAEMAKTLPGIGERTAPKIVESRPYATPQDLVTKKVLTPAQLAKIKDLVAY